MLVDRSVLVEPYGGWCVRYTNDGSTRKKFQFSTIDVTGECCTDGMPIFLSLCFICWGDTCGNTSGVCITAEFGTIKVNHYRIKDVVEVKRKEHAGYDVGALDRTLKVNEKKKLVGLHSIS